MTTVTLAAHSCSKTGTIVDIANKMEIKGRS